MPIYNIRNNETNEVYEELCSYSALQELLKTNSHLSLELSAPSISYNDAKKPDEGFRDILRSIKQRNRGSNINTF